MSHSRPTVSRWLARKMPKPPLRFVATLVYRDQRVQPGERSRLGVHALGPSCLIAPDRPRRRSQKHYRSSAVYPCPSCLDRGTSRGSLSAVGAKGGSGRPNAVPKVTFDAGRNQPIAPRRILLICGSFQRFSGTGKGATFRPQRGSIQCGYCRHGPERSAGWPGTASSGHFATCDGWRRTLHRRGSHAAGKGRGPVGF